MVSTLGDHPEMKATVISFSGTGLKLKLVLSETLRVPRGVVRRGLRTPFARIPFPSNSPEFARIHFPFSKRNHFIRKKKKSSSGSLKGHANTAGSFPLPAEEHLSGSVLAHFRLCLRRSLRKGSAPSAPPLAWLNGN